MPEFFLTSAGLAVFGVVAAAVLLLLIELNYKFFAKAALDFLFGIAAVLVCSPMLIFGAIVSKVRSGKVFETKEFLGAKGKIVYLHSFARDFRVIKNLPRLFDVVAGRLSFVGVKPMEVRDGALMDDEQMERFFARPGIFCHLAVSGSAETSYEDMFELDARYFRRRSFFKDIYIILKVVVLAIRGEGKSYLGEAGDKSYAEALLARGEITEADFKNAEAYAEKAIKDNKKAEDFKKRLYNG